MKGKLHWWTGTAVLLVVLTTLQTATLSAQGDARFTGTVRDVSGAVVSGATVTVRNEKTGEERTTTSNAAGAYTVGSLKPSLYTVRVAAAQFGPTELSGLQLLPAQELAIDLELRPQGVTESVTVSAAPSLLDMSSARIGTNVIEREVKDLPINGRQLSQLYLQAPGSVNSGTGTFGDIRFSGRAVQQNIIRYDGVEGSAIIDASPGNLNGELPSPFRLQSSLENVQEFRVESSNYPAEYGTGTGGQITVISKSGANNVNGSLFEYYRSDRFDSANYFDLAKSPLKQNQFGASVGLPLKRDRTFLFGSYEGYRLESGVNIVEAVPSASAWSRAVPAVLPLREAFLGPGAVILPGASTNPDFEIAQLQENVEVQEDAFSGRLDHRLSSNWSVYGRYYRDEGSNTQPEGVTGRSSYITARPQNAVVALQGILGPTVLNELKVGYNSADTSIAGRAPTINGIDLSQISLNLSGSVANSGSRARGRHRGLPPRAGSCGRTVRRTDEARRTRRIPSR